MSIKNEFTEAECNYFRRECNFTADERKVFDLRVKGMSIVEISMKLPSSEATVKRRLRAIKFKIIKVL